MAEKAACDDAKARLEVGGADEALALMQDVQWATTAADVLVISKPEDAKATLDNWLAQETAYEKNMKVQMGTA